jgi:hypothetical protein
MKRALAALDERSLIAARLRSLGVAVNLFGRYLDLSSAETCSLLNGTKRLTAERAEEFKEMLDDLELVARAFAPAPVDFKDTETIRNLIRSFRDGSLLVFVQNQGAQTLVGFGAL